MTDNGFLRNNTEKKALNIYWIDQRQNDASIWMNLHFEETNSKSLWFYWNNFCASTKLRYNDLILFFVFLKIRIAFGWDDRDKSTIISLCDCVHVEKDMKPHLIN